LFGYMGPRPAPVLPPWDVFVWPNAIRQIGYTMIPCNWLQCQENAADPVHSVYLHGHYFRYVLEREGLLAERAADPETHRAFVSMRSGTGFDRVISKVDEYGLQKAMVYRKDLGAARDREAWHSYMIFPNYTRPGGGAVRHELQVRVPVDDTTTLHLLYDIYVAPEGVAAPHQEVVPYYEVPMTGPDGKPILDYVLAQDMVAWWSQGPIADRTQERLGATDEAIRRFRRLLEEQMQVVEAGGDPMNVFRDPEAVGDVIHLKPRIDERRDDTGLVGYRSMYHRGYFQDDADRYGPALPLVVELMAKAEQLESEQGVAAEGPAPDNRGVTADVS
ncbi:MAG: Rieske (2Fe-2S) protein, partial [Acidobacteriota bacterium]|nr:Rieske (2Fe-2S) protein [Acidobacteriota bacterium]